MKQSKLHALSCSSRIKLAWLTLLLLVGITYLSCSSKIYPRAVTRSEAVGNVLLNSIASEAEGISTVGIDNDDNRETVSRGSYGGGEFTSYPPEEYDAGGSEELGDHELDYDPELSNDTDSGIDSEIDGDYEMNSDSNSSQWDGKRYNFTTGEFGVIFSEPNNDVVDDDELQAELNETGDYETQMENQDTSNEPSVVESIQPHVSPSEAPKPDHNAGVSTHQSLPKFKDRVALFGRLRHVGNLTNPHCDTSTPFRSWEKKVVTQIGIPIKKDCMKLRTYPKREVQKVKLHSQVTQWKSKKPWEQLALKYKKMNCEDIRHDFQHNFYVSEVEKNFPIAYILVVYTNAGQILRLLKAIYRPHNLYCIHPDAKQGDGFANFFRAIAKCLDNVFVVSNPLRVYYAHHSIMDAQLKCMDALMKYPATRWKYVINLCGREVPLKTNREIVNSLQKLKGYTALNLKNLTPNFWNARFRFKLSLDRRGNLRRTHRRLSKPPIKIYKSMNFIAASREFVSFMLYNPISHKLRKYVSPVYAPEEHFYSSLYALPQAKGARPPKGLLGHNDMPEVDAFIWANTKWQQHQKGYLCPGKKIVHGICILSGADLQRIEKLGVSSKHPVFFFNKYFLEWDPTPMDCMEERLVRTNREEYWQDCVSVRHKH